jgi:hypothetical protein
VVAARGILHDVTSFRNAIPHSPAEELAVVAFGRLDAAGGADLGPLKVADLIGARLPVIVNGLALGQASHTGQTVRRGQSCAAHLDRLLHGGIHVRNLDVGQPVRRSALPRIIEARKAVVAGVQPVFSRCSAVVQPVFTRW